jgi:biotin carboxyl carrier protein
MIEIEAEMDASVWQVLVEPGQSIAKDDELIILESMKMEIPVVAPIAGVVATLHVSEGDAVKRGQKLVVLEPSDGS